MNAASIGSIDRAPARELLQPLVAIGHAGGAQHGLHRLTSTSQAASKSAAMRCGSASTLASPRPSELQAISVCPSATPRLRSTVESVRSRCQRETGSFRRSGEQRIGDTAVAFRILEVDRVDLVRHGRGADLAGHRALAQVAQRDVAPDVARQVDEDHVDRGERIAVLADPVVRLDLRGQGLYSSPSELDEARATAGQSSAGQRADVGVEVADRAIPLAEDRHRRPALPARASGARRSWRISLPKVVGLAGWPCVRAGMAVSA